MAPSAGGTAAERANRAPTIERVALEPPAPQAGGAVRVVVEARDADGDPVKMTYEWLLRGEPVGNGTSKLMLIGSARGDALEATVVASDGRADSEPTAIAVKLANQPPSIDRLRMGPAREITAGQPVAVSPEASDAEGDALTFTYTWLVNDEPVGSSGADAAELETTDLESGDVVRVEVVAHDGTDASEPFGSPVIRVTNRPPHIVSRPGASPDGNGFHYQLEAEDPDGDSPLRFELEDAPQGMQIGAHSGEVDWLPRPDQAGRHQIRVIVDDLRGGRVAHAFEVNVGGSGPPAARTP